MSTTVQCANNFTNGNLCQLSPTCKGWGCRFLTTVIEEIPQTEKEKAKLFVKVYQEAKQKKVLECPHYRSVFIDEVLETQSWMKQIIDEKRTDSPNLLSDSFFLTAATK